MNMMHVTWDSGLVLASVFIAFLASFSALDTVARVTDSRGMKALLWLVGGGAAMGIGIWSMHFIGMMAMHFTMPMRYNPSETVFSIVVAVLGSIVALWAVFRHNQFTLTNLLLGSIILGTSVVAMHYTGMAGLRINQPIIWQKTPVIISIVIAYSASAVALWLAFRLRNNDAGVLNRRFIAALVMGAAIAGMHYTGMYAAHFDTTMQVLPGGLGSQRLTIWVFMFTLVILGSNLFGAMIESQLRVSRLASKLKQTNEELRQMALHDPLTNLANRTLFEDKLNDYIQRAKQNASSFSLLYMDLDGFKMVNDAYGHDIGDKLLVEVAKRLNAAVNPSDILARVGGDEFVLLSHANSEADASRLAETLVAAIEPEFTVENYELRVSLSLGIAMFPAHGIEAREMLFNADSAMYHTKNSGRNGFSIYQPSMSPIGRSQVQLKNELWRAIHNNELRLFYQPKLNVTSGEIIGYEALVRWQHPERGLKTPDKFLPIAEQTGMILLLGEWVLNEACRQLAIWHQQGADHLSISVNLSAQQFEQKSLIYLVTRTLEEYCLAPDKLILEITETTAMRYPQESIKILEELKAIGVQVAIDDFGTGYSSLLYLQNMPATELKIDRAFINSIGHKDTDPRLLSMIIELAKNMNLNIVAEGVESEEQQTYLVNLGCDVHQGYYFSRPVPPSEITVTATKYQARA
ncbi:EAL domain-containing protein [Rosenbergiella epipactidis]|uniref:bifunctional diguanylate cyclase/phosphodiesterase n=1 Tax=Rosenbergiella epipactidis TaxID=1544694 RepID=UPI00202611BD|nr:EAL domain-containing protein [Rosenbergiella epipactidis]MCL9667527.1 EAL domain-containing protein [Rosenbergiella epipactidis]